MAFALQLADAPMHFDRCATYYHSAASKHQDVPVPRRTPTRPRHVLREELPYRPPEPPTILYAPARVRRDASSCAADSRSLRIDATRARSRRCQADTSRGFPPASYSSRWSRRRQKSPYQWPLWITNESPARLWMSGTTSEPGKNRRLCPHNPRFHRGTRQRQVIAASADRRSRRLQTQKPAPVGAGFSRSYFLPWFFTASIAAAAASGSRYRPPGVSGFIFSSSS